VSIDEDLFPTTTPQTELSHPPHDCLECPLRAIVLFTPLDQETIERIQSARVGTRHLAKGQHICLEEEPVTEAFTLFNGHAFSYRLLPDGKRQITRFILPGDFLFVTDHESETTWPFSAEVVEQSTICVLSGDAMNRLFAERIQIAQSLVYIHQVEERFLSEHITDLGRRTALERLARLYLELFRRKQLRGRVSGSRCYLPFTQEQLGDAIGLTSVHVSRLHTELQKAQLLSHQRRWLQMYDFERTASRFDYDPAYIQKRPLI
jgi:CRP/FNR family transcriptional regulator